MTHHEKVTPSPSLRQTRRRAVRILQATAALVVASAVSAPRAEAYIDPGSGALIWQGLLAAAFGLMFYLKGFVRLVKAKLHIGAPKEGADGDDGQQSDRT